MRTLHAHHAIHSLAAAAGLAWPMWASATPPIDQFGSLAYACAGERNSNGIPVQSIELGALFTTESKCKEAFSPAMDLVKAKATHAVSGTSSGVARPAASKLRVRL